MYECLAHVTPGIVVFATHYGEDILDGGNHGMTLVEQTALTSRNITGGHVMNVLCSRATSNPNLNPSPSPSPDPNPNPNSNPNPNPSPNPSPSPDPNPNPNPNPDPDPDH